MSNPTTPFSWQMPTATDLVTDLPADFEVFGQAVATSMADLLGGASGYILAKNSATDMDFVWIANDQGDITGVTAGTGITITSPTGPVPTVSINTAVTADLTTAQTLTNKTLTSPVLTTPSISNINAKGDILVGTADNTLGIVTVGSNYGFLQADSAQGTGLLWNNAAWTTYTPTVSAQSGTYTSVTGTGRYIRVGKLCIVQNNIAITTNGTAAVQTIITAPFTAANTSVVYQGCGRENAATGTMLQSRIGSNAGSIYIADYTGAYYGANGRTFDTITVFEVA